MVGCPRMLAGVDRNVVVPVGIVGADQLGLRRTEALNGQVVEIADIGGIVVVAEQDHLFGPCQAECGGEPTNLTYVADCIINTSDLLNEEAKANSPP